jgi:toxin YoeB
MEIKLLKQEKADLEYWKKSGNTAIMKRITALLKDIAEHPYTGIGKPEQLKFDLAGKWSRRINAEHRIIYTVKDDMLIVYVLSMKYHYSKK